MLIGLGGGAASSVGSGASAEDLDFASVQRGNPEIQRRAQEVIDQCWALGEANPILLIHDVGAGGLSNAIPESIAHSHRGGRIDLRAVPSDEPGMSPLEIWCNEAQERYVLVVAPEHLERFAALCARERCPYAVVGETTDDGWLKVADPQFNNAPVDVPLDVILGKPPKMLRDVRRVPGARRCVRCCGHRCRRSGLPAAALPGGRRQDVPHHDRRPHRRRHDQSRSDGRAVAGAGQRRRGHAQRLHVAQRRSDGDGRAHAARAARRAASGRMAVAEAVTNIAAADIGAISRRAPVGELDGRVRRARRRRGSVRDGARRSARNSVRRSASRFRSARIRCR